MNREIKFRAKRTDGLGWAYGYFVKTPITTEFSCEGQFLDTGATSKGRYCIIEDMVAHEVDSETVGQSTALKDKNKVVIYEGDIIELKEKSKSFASGKYDLFSVKWLETGFEYKIRMSLEHSEVIGNIYDNKELLE